MPEPGDSDDYDWTGYVPFEDLPHAFNPPSGLIATANGRVVPDGYRFFITHEWAPPFRTARIFQLLESGREFEVRDMLRIQMDIAPLDDQWLAKELQAAAVASQRRGHALPAAGAGGAVVAAGPEAAPLALEVPAVPSDECSARPRCRA